MIECGRFISYDKSGRILLLYYSFFKSDLNFFESTKKNSIFQSTFMYFRMWIRLIPERMAQVFQVDRLNRIREMVRYHRSVDVNELSAALNVSEVTVRRDLEKLEQEGFLKRVYGGATICEKQEQIAPVQKNEMDSRLLSYEQLPHGSKIVGETAAGMVGEYEVIYIGAGMSGLALAREIKDRHGVIVVSNYLPICLELMHSQVRVIITGGELDSKDSTFKIDHIDYEACLVPIEKAFIPFRGFDLQNGYAFNDREELQIYQRLKEHSKFMIGMIEGNLFDKRGFVTMEDDDSISAIVSDRDIPDQYRDYYFEKNISLYEGMRFE